LLGIDDAIGATTKITPGKLALGESAGISLSRRLQIENKGPVGKYYDLGQQAAVSTAANVAWSTLPQGATVTFSPSSLFVPAGGTGAVDLGFVPLEALPDRALYGGFINVAPRDGGDPLVVPYAGLKGDYQSVTAMDPAVSRYGNPLLRPSRTWGPSQPVAIDLTNGTTADDLAWFWINLAYPVRTLRFEVFEATTGQSWGRAGELPYFSRSQASYYFWTLSWGGDTLKKGPVPSGTYVMKVSVLKPLGNDENPADWETWISPTITIVR
jgi:hypothetical protein